VKLDKKVVADMRQS